MCFAKSEMVSWERLQQETVEGHRNQYEVSFPYDQRYGGCQAAFDKYQDGVGRSSSADAVGLGMMSGWSL